MLTVRMNRVRAAGVIWLVGAGNPARALGFPSAVLEAGARADLVVLDADLAVSCVMHRGSWVTH